VDDNPTNQDVLLAALQKNYRHGIAKDGNKAMEFAKANHPDVILLDIKMPGMDGYDVCAKLKKTHQTRDIPIIFITALTATEEKLRGFEAGGVDFITKPFSPPEVMARINTHPHLSEKIKRFP
jgi:CheY-like chemotaxis protein